MRDDNVYRCEITASGRKKYIPFGRRYDENYLPDGIWYVRHTDHSIGTASLSWLQNLYKVGEVVPRDFPKLCAMHDYAEYVMNHEEFKKMIDGPVSLADIVHKTVALMLHRSEEVSNENTDTR